MLQALANQRTEIENRLEDALLRAAGMLHRTGAAIGTQRDDAATIVEYARWLRGLGSASDAALVVVTARQASVAGKSPSAAW